MIELIGTPTDQDPSVLATGRTDADFAFISMSSRDPGGRDADYIEWHTLDHRPEQYRVAGIRNAMRLVSTPACRAARVAEAPPFDKLDHVMTYQFASTASMPMFTELGAALDRGGRMAHRLPSIGYMTGTRAGMKAAPRAAAGADVLPWRPSLGVYIVVEQGQSSPEALVDLPGVAGVWWFHGLPADGGMAGDMTDKQITYCYLDRDPVECAGALGEAMQARWAGGSVKGLLAAPFYVAVPYDWGRHVP
jgi:hypothetical protein